MVKNKYTYRPGANPFDERIRQRSISNQLTVILIVAIGVISIAVIGAMHIYRLHVAKDELEAKADELYTYLEGILGKSLWDIDVNNIQIIGENISQNDVVAKLTIKDSFDHTIFEMIREPESPVIQRGGTVYHNGAQAGHFVVALSQSVYYEGSRQLLFASLFTLVIALFVLILTTGFLIRRFLKAPLDSLSDILDAYSAGNYDLGHAKIPYLEFQPFRRVLNEMGKTITLQLMEVRQAEEKYRNIFENAVEGIFQSTIDGRFISVSPSMARMYGYDSPDELISAVTNISKQCYADADVREAFARQLIQDGLVQRYETQMIRRDNSRFWVSISARLVSDEKGSPLFFEGFCVDITKQKNLETQLRQAQKMEAIGTLAGGIAHDFNNILGVIIGCSELALEKIPSDEDDAILLDKVLVAGNRAKELVKQILTFSRQDQSKFRPFYLSPIVKEALKFIRATMPATIEIEQHIDNDTGAILADPTQVHQLLMNLYTNAVHAMQQQGGILSVRVSDRDFNAEEAAIHADLTAGPYIEICVRDTGRGIPPETIERIFDPFFTTKPVGEGTGLGLSMVHGIVKKNNGAVLVESQPDHGTVFKVYLPRLDKRYITIETETVGEAPKGSERIMLVDDEKELLDTLRQILEGLGYHVTAMTNSRNAHDHFRGDPNAFDLVIADLTMPHMTGMDLTEALRLIRSDLPIIISTGFSEHLAAKQAHAAGVKEVLLKPVSRWRLAAAVRKALDDSNPKTTNRV